MERAPIDYIFTAIVWMVFFGVLWWMIESLVRAFRNRYFVVQSVQPGAAPVQPQVSTVSVNSEPEEDGDGGTDAGTDVGPSALHEAADRLQVDKSRRAIIDTLVLAGWDVETIRNRLKGSNSEIGDEIKEAREQLGIVDPPRIITINGRPVRMEA